jgi:hypothetical protein
MGNLVTSDLRIEAVEAEPKHAILLHWRGRSNERQPAKTLAPYFTDVLSSAVSRTVPLEMHFEELEYFNSSTITYLIQLIQDARQKGIRLTLVYNPVLKWQKLSFDALRVFAKDGMLELRGT